MGFNDSPQDIANARNDEGVKSLDKRVEQLETDIKILLSMIQHLHDKIDNQWDD